ncbi:MAG: hypothetical protein HYT70_02230 [Candidatus Aenigmarchaeota archaeon]|nr:hypothetical protein [Candidatus Aenigmarchaeota archaeon]
MAEAIAKETGARVSLKSSRILLGEIRGKKTDKAKRLLNDLIGEKRSLDGKYYTKTAEKVLDILESAEANAKNKTMNVERLFIKNAVANKPEKRMLPKSRVFMRGRAAKGAHIEIVLEER